MEKYREVKTITRRPEANKTTAALESAGIPVMIEHVETEKDNDLISEFRVLVPSEMSQTASQVIKAATMMKITSLN